MNEIVNAYNLFEENKPDQAIQVIDSYLPYASNEDKETIAELYMQWGFLEEAMEILVDLVKQNPEISDFKVLLASLYIENNQDDEAILLLNEITEEDEIYVQALIQLADLYQSQGLFEVSEHKLLEAKQIMPNENIIDFALGELYFSTGDYKKAAMYFELISEELMTEVSITERLAESYAAVGEYETALNYFSQLDSEDPDTLFKYGFTAFQTHRYDIAINAWEKVIEKDPLYHSAYLELSKAYQEEGLVDKSYEIALDGIKVDEFNKELYFQAGTLAHKLDDDENSDKWIDYAIALDNDYKDAIIFKINLYKEKDDFDSIIKLIKKIQATESNDSMYDWELARAYNEIESYDEALKHYRKAYNSFKEDSDFLREYGYFLIEDGKNEQGIEVFLHYLHYVPDDFEIRELTERFD